MQIRPISVLRVCRRRIHQGVQTWGNRTHLIYFGAVAATAHGWEGGPALVCLLLGVAAEITATTDV